MRLRDTRELGGLMIVVLDWKLTSREAEDEDFVSRPIVVDQVVVLLAYLLSETIAESSWDGLSACFDDDRYIVLHTL